LNIPQLRLVWLLRYDLFAKYLRPHTYTIIHQYHSVELSAIWKGKLIGGYMIKIWFEQAVQYPDKNSTDLWLLLLQIDIADVGNDFSTWSVFCESANVPDVRVTNDDLVLCVNDPRHASFGHRLLLPANVHGTLLVYRFLHAVIFTFFW